MLKFTKKKILLTIMLIFGILLIVLREKVFDTIGKYQNQFQGGNGQWLIRNFP